MFFKFNKCSSSKSVELEIFLDGISECPITFNVLLDMLFDIVIVKRVLVPIYKM